MSQPDLRRVQALSRDESALRKALQKQSDLRFDVDATGVVRERTRDLLETLSLFAVDEQLWGKLVEGTGVLERDQISVLEWFDDLGLGAMLIASGYSYPPPPPVDELLSNSWLEFQHGLAVGASPAQVRSAQLALILFVRRVRWQLDPASPASQVAPVVASLARRTGAVARSMLPIAVAAMAGAAVESFLPGTGLGYVAGAGAKAVTEHGVEIAASTAVGSWLGEPRGVAEPPGPDDVVTPDDAIRVHVTHARELLMQVYRSMEWDAVEFGVVDGVHMARLLRAASRHADRVGTLAVDHNAVEWLPVAARVAAEALRRAADVAAREGDVSSGRERLAEVLDLANRALTAMLKHSFPASEGVHWSYGPFAYDRPSPPSALRAEMDQLWSELTADRGGGARG